MNKKIFLISLPRSGSTLLQRAICSHNKISSSAEPWVMLPLMQPISNVIQQSEYGSDLAKEAITDFLSKNGGKKHYYESVRKFADNYYSTSEGSVFLDKTPRYHLIVDELYECFPDALFIILWRNPVSVVNSLINTWGHEGKRWRLRAYNVDLHQGLNNMWAFHNKHKESKRVLSINYEDFVRQPLNITNAIFRTLGLEPMESIDINDSLNQIDGIMGDKTGVAEYSSVSGEWMQNIDVFCNFKRRNWMRGYIKGKGGIFWDEIGYSESDLLNLIEDKRNKMILRDGLEEILQFSKLVFNLRRFDRKKSITDIFKLGELR
ncbi:sulfotransferase family protein [Vibrio mediterranei]|uniref:sulfotransferase family protein n=1 Tax=Vibrio mediterranei TaxID=689 RepID=UPI00148C0E8E|nr:sulfotransferase [Vibrio mediterranei]